MKRLSVLALALLLAGCGKWFSAPAEQGGEASGEVLPGTASDAMIPLDELKSEAPLAPRQAATDAPDDLDAEQPVVTPAEGIEGAPAAPAAAPAGPGPATPP